MPPRSTARAAGTRGAVDLRFTSGAICAAAEKPLARGSRSASSASWRSGIGRERGRPLARLAGVERPSAGGPRTPSHLYLKS
eukprot:2053150-Prymnesium_polylepis.2